MAQITFKNTVFECREGESLLDACFRQQLNIPFSCRSGTCQICLMRVVSGKLPGACQTGLRPQLVESGHFMPCCCYFSDTNVELEIDLPLDSELFIPCKIMSIEELSSTICSIELSTNIDISYKAGQFINLRRHEDKLTRSYSISSVYKKDENLFIHVQKIPKGNMSNWLTKPVRIDKTGEIEIQYPMGDAHFSGKNFSENRLLIVTGSGLGAALAIIHEALKAGCTGEFHLFHGTRNQAGLYYKENLQKLTSQYKNIHYYPCVTGQSLLPGNYTGRATDIAFEKFNDLTNWEIYLYGNPDMVATGKSLAITRGGETNNLYADSFEFTSIFHKESHYNANIDNTSTMEFTEEAPVLSEPNSELWNALGNGVILKKALNHFYTEVFKDAKLSPFFKGVTKEHVAGKQYAFLNQIFTGNDAYFGDRPRNAHHWMVISNELFDHREALFERCCRESGIDEKSLQILLEFDQRFRPAMVKTRPWSRITKGKIEPLKGFEEMLLDVGTMCDSCQKEVQPNTTVIYHGQTGELLCPDCTGSLS